MGKVVLVFCGAVSLVAGILFLFFPKALQKANDNFNKATSKVAVSLDEQVLRVRAGMGISCILIAVGCFFLVYWIIKKHG